MAHIGSMDDPLNLYDRRNRRFPRKFSPRRLDVGFKPHGLLGLDRRRAGLWFDARKRMQHRAGFESRRGMNDRPWFEARRRLDAPPRLDLRRGRADRADRCALAGRDVGGADGAAQQPDHLQVQRRDDQACGSFQAHACR